MSNEKFLFQLTIDEFQAIQNRSNSKLISDAWQKFQNHNTPAKQDFLTIKQVSEITGYSVSTLYTKCSKGEIKYYKPPGTKFLRFKRSDVIDFMNG